MNANPIQYRCQCGHELRVHDSIPESYALLREDSYEELIANEARLHQSEDVHSEERAELFYNQSQRIGSMVICPVCDRLIVCFPNDPARESDQLLHYYRPCE